MVTVNETNRAPDGTFEALEAATIIDGADVSHTDELADITDVSAIQSSSDVTVENTSTSGAGGTVPTSQGDGTLAMEAISSGGGPLTQTELSNATFINKDVFSVGANKYGTIFNVNTPVTVYYASVYGPEVGNMRYTFGDGSTVTESVRLHRGADDDGTGASVTAIPRVADVQTLEFENEGNSTRNYGVMAVHS